MKLSLISYESNHPEKYWNLILETIKDVEQYFEASSNLSAHQFVDIWPRLKGGQTWPHHFNKRVHQVSLAGALIAITMKAEQTGSVSLIEACEIHDKLLYGKYRSMLKIILMGKMVRVGSKGGYSIFDCFFTTHEEVECSDEQMREFIISYDNVKITLSFKKPVVVIENDSMLSDKMERHFRYHDSATTDYIYHFKYRTENWKYEEYFKLFDDAVKNGTHTIMAETTLCDAAQFGALAKVAKNVMIANPSFKLAIKLLINGEVSELAPYIVNLPENLVVEVLNRQ